MKQQRSWYFFFLLSAITACKKDSTGTPFINSVSPLKGAYNTEVLIRGRYFAQSDNIVRFNNLPAEIISVSDTLLKVKVPKSAETGDIVITTGGTTVQGPEFQYEYTVTVSTVAGNGTPGFTEGNGTAVSLKTPEQMVFDKDDNLYFIDQVGAAIRKMSSAGDIITYAGSSTPATAADGTGINARFGHVRDICTDRNTHTLYAVDFPGASWVGDRISKITPEGNVGKVTAIYAGGSAGYGYADHTNIQSAQFRGLYGCVTDNNGNLFVVDAVNNCIRKINFTGTGVSTLAGKGTYSGYAEGQGTEAMFSDMMDIIIDGSGNLLVPDINNHRVRKITAAGLTTTLAGNGAVVETNGPLPAGFYYPTLAAQDKKGNLLIVTADGNRIRLITPSGKVHTLIPGNYAGYQDGKATEAKFNRIMGIAIDSKNRVFVSDNGNHRIRRIDIE
jgi:hypothetical protein